MSKADAEKRAKALDWLTILLKEQPQLSMIEAVEQTALRFDLSPLEEEWLLRQLQKDKPV